jgi:NAD(P)-dependent dehydrogenase (short-subunit alcohol dehydrogenase family)
MPSERMQAAIVTGVSRGLGASLAATLLEQGFTVLGVGRAPGPVPAGGRFRFVRFDLADAARVDETIAPEFAALAAAKPASVCLLNNAATAGPVGTLGTLAAADVVGSLAVNLAAVVAIANLFCRLFTDPAQPRRIINVSSGAAQTALPGESLYCVAKAGMEMLTRALAVEQTASTFRAISLRPGIIDTDMQLFARSQARETLPCVDMFREFHSQGRLVPPGVVAKKIVDKLVLGEVEHGRTYSYQEL